MVIDFHVHGKIKSSFPFDKEKFLLTINEAKENGIDSLAITEHCNAKDFLEGYEFLSSNYKMVGDYYDVDGFKVFYGMEVTTKQYLDILIIGRPNLVLELREKIINRLNGEEYLDIETLFNIDIPDELLVILAHPYRKHLEFPKLKAYIIERLDATEFNAKDLYKYGIIEMQDKVSRLATKLNLTVLCDSDTHYFIQMSSARNIFNKDCKTIEEIKEEIKSRNYTIQVSDELNIRVKSATIIKKLICNKE